MGVDEEPHQSTEQVKVGATTQGNIPYMTDDNLLGHFGGAIQNQVFIRPSTLILQDTQKSDCVGGVYDPFDILHLEGLVGLEALVDLLKAK